MASSPASGPGGGGVSPVGAYVRLSATTTINTATQIPYDVVVHDPAGYWDAVNHIFVVPPGKAGLHLIGWQGQFNDDGVATSAELKVAISWAVANLDIPLLKENVPSLTGVEWSGAASMASVATEGDSIDTEFRVAGSASLDLRGGANGSGLWIVYLGPNA